MWSEFSLKLVLWHQVMKARSVGCDDHVPLKLWLYIHMCLFTWWEGTPSYPLQVTPYPLQVTRHNVTPHKIKQ